MPVLYRQEERVPASASRSKSPIPQYRLHKARGLGVVTLNGKDYYLGPYDAPQSREAYNRLVADWLSNGRQILPKMAAVTVEELTAAFMRHAGDYYRKPDGTPPLCGAGAAKA
jgi:hypothetical protein